MDASPGSSTPAPPATRAGDPGRRARRRPRAVLTLDPARGTRAPPGRWCSTSSRQRSRWSSSSPPGAQATGAGLFVLQAGGRRRHDPGDERRRRRHARLRRRHRPSAPPPPRVRRRSGPDARAGRPAGCREPSWTGPPSRPARPSDATWWTRWPATSPTSSPRSTAATSAGPGAPAPWPPAGRRWRTSSRAGWSACWRSWSTPTWPTSSWCWGSTGSSPRWPRRGHRARRGRRGIALVLALFAFANLPVNWVGIVLILVAAGLFLAESQVASHGLFTLAGLGTFIAGSVLLFRPQRRALPLRRRRGPQPLAGGRARSGHRRRIRVAPAPEPGHPAPAPANAMPRDGETGIAGPMVEATGTVQLGARPGLRSGPAGHHRARPEGARRRAQGPQADRGAGGRAPPPPGVVKREGILGPR